MTIHDQFEFPFAPQPRLYLTRNQDLILNKIRSLGSLHFSSAASALIIRPRLWPLLAGPTGSGKSFIVKQAADALEAGYLRITYGDWLVQGGKGYPTLFRVIDAACQHQRVVVHLDELDKVPADSAQDYTRAMANDLWSLLDGELPVAVYCAGNEQRVPLTPLAMGRLMREGVARQLFIVGSGTWQRLFEKERESTRAIGFAHDRCALAPARSWEAGEGVRNELRKVTGPTAELLARFHADTLVLTPPQTEEALGLLRHSGAEKFARTTGFDAEGYLGERLPVQGFRAVESLITELLLAGWRPSAVWPAPGLTADCAMKPNERK